LVLQQLSIRGRPVQPQQIIQLLTKYRLLPSLLRELIIDDAIASFSCSDSDIDNRIQELFAQNHLIEKTQQQAWISGQGFRDDDHFLQWIERQIKLEQFKLQSWGAKLESYFLQRKSDLDQVIYSFIRVNQEGLALELYCQLVEDDASFPELAKHYSEGFERSTGGMIGPCELSKPHPELRRKLISSTPGEVCYPMQLGEWWVIVRLEQLLPAQLSATIRQQLLNELFENWIQEQIADCISRSEKRRLI
jgi:parvulin-like peptidyl-prolyl isomerase